MNLGQIKEKALEEKGNIDEYIDAIIEATNTNPLGMDLSVPRHLVHKIVSYCDMHNIPVYHVAEGTISCAATYSALLEREERR